jgi:hypothetical protein
LKQEYCAIYTCKSSEEGLEQEFDSLHAQREACEAYPWSQRSEGWQVSPDTMVTSFLSPLPGDSIASRRLSRRVFAHIAYLLVVAPPPDIWFRAARSNLGQSGSMPASGYAFDIFISFES